MVDMDGIPEKTRLIRLGELMHQRRLELDLSKFAVASAAGISINTYRRLEEGQPVRDVTYAKVESVLGWAAGSAQRILNGTGGAVEVHKPGRGVVVEVPEEELTDSVQRAAIAVSDDLTAAQIRDLSRRVLEDLKKRGIL